MKIVEKNVAENEVIREKRGKGIYKRRKKYYNIKRLQPFESEL